MDKELIGKTFLTSLSNLTLIAKGGSGILAIINMVISFLTNIPSDQKDYFIDLVEANNFNNKTVMIAMRVVRFLVNCPDEVEEIDQTKPI